MKRYLLVKVKAIMGLVLVACCGAVQATPEDVMLKTFGSNSLVDITSKKSGRPFMMVLWSIDCPPCIKELSLFRDFQPQLSKKNIVLISTDGSESVPAIQQVLADHQLGQFDNWIFSGEMVERIRYGIDPEWYGELPRTYFYESEGDRVAHSGMLTKKLLTEWLQYSESLPKSDSQ